MRQATQPKRSEPIRAVLAVSPKTFVTIWWMIQLFHVFCVVNSYAIIGVHRYCLVTNLGTTIAYLGTTTFSFFKPVIAAHVVLIVCHTTAFCVTVWWSAKNREWWFSELPTDVRQRTNNSSSGPSSVNAVTASPCCAATAKLAVVVKRPLKVVSKVLSAFLSQMDMYGVEGSHYEVGFFALELVEIAFQTYHAYKLSGLVSRVWINRLNAVVLILNCWSAVVVHSLVRRDRIVKRVVLLVVDAFFDVITSMVIPFVIFYPYYMQFDFTLPDFPHVNYYDDGWWIQAISENRQIFVMSWFDFVSKLSTSFSTFATMLVLKQYLAMD